MKTEALYLTKNGSANVAFEKREHSLAELEDDEIQIAVTAFGLNYADVMARRGLYRECPPLPTVLGYEVVGEIVSVGNTKNDQLIGKKVVAFTRFGGYAKHINTKVEAAVPIGNLPEEKALALATQYVTAYYMSNVVTQVLPGEKVLIHAAAGGVGTALIQLLKLKEAVLFAKTGNDEKIDYLKELGVDHCINYNRDNYGEKLNTLLGEERLSISFNPVAGSTFKTDLGLIGASGRLVLFGGSERSGKKWGILSTLNFLRKMGLILPISLMMRSKSIIGVNMLKIADNHPEIVRFCLKEVVKLALDGKIDPKIGGEFNAEEIVKAHDFLESGNSTGKIVVKW